MTTIAHLSDLHFGTEDPEMVDGLLRDLHEVKPTLVAISGDLTQRARRAQFAAARAFLQQVPAPLLVVPGNHDVPLYNVYSRFLRPLTKYRRYISDDLTPRFEHEQLVALGVNTARSATWKNGRISHAQMMIIRQFFSGVRAEVLKVLVTHHPFMPPPEDPTEALVGRGFSALQVAETAGVDLLLAGHLHVGYSGDIRTHHLGIERSMLVIHAGTAISHRRREEFNAYNVIELAPPQLKVTVRAWTLGRYAPLRSATYVKTDNNWTSA